MADAREKYEKFWSQRFCARICRSFLGAPHIIRVSGTVKKRPVKIHSFTNKNYSYIKKNILEIEPGIFFLGSRGKTLLQEKKAHTFTFFRRKYSSNCILTNDNF